MNSDQLSRARGTLAYLNEWLRQYQESDGLKQSGANDKRRDAETKCDDIRNRIRTEFESHHNKWLYSIAFKDEIENGSQGLEHLHEFFRPEGFAKRLERLVAKARSHLDALEQS